MAAQLIEIDPELAHQHAVSASRRAGRIAIVRESLAITAYATGDFALALRELRTYRRISGNDDQIALMVDSERGVGRPDAALELGRAVDRAKLAPGVRVELAIAMSGARLDLGETERALLELDIPELDPDRAFEWSPALFAARATVLEELGRTDEANEWNRRAVVAAEVLHDASGDGDLEVIEIEEVEEIETFDDAEEVDESPEQSLSRRRTTTSTTRTRPRTMSSTRPTMSSSSRGSWSPMAPNRSPRRRSVSKTRCTSSSSRPEWTSRRGRRRGEQSLMALFSRRTAESTPLDGVDVVLADLDGVVYAGAGALPHAVDSLNRAREGRRLGYITNNASRTDVSVAAHLTELGLQTRPDEVVTSPQAAMRLLAERVPAGTTVLVVGGDGLVTEVEKAGFVVTRSADDAPGAVVQGFAPEVGWTELAEAAYALKVPEEEGGIPWIATNTDWTIPQSRGIAPGNGTLVSAVHTAVGRLATVAGKPESPIFVEAVARFGAQHPLFLGDRLDTDILGANRAGVPSVLVLTGIDRPKHVLAAPADSQPTYILGDLRELHEPYPEATVRDGVVSVRGASVRIDGPDVRILSEGDRPVDLLRAGAKAIWDTGRAIYGFRVPERLYADPFHRP